jgi:hypothetical protein
LWEFSGVELHGSGIWLVAGIIRGIETEEKSWWGGDQVVIDCENGKVFIEYHMPSNVSFARKDVKALIS